MTRLFTDMIGNEVIIPYPPRRIISLVPSQTELLFDLGLDKEVVGITKFCVHPNDWFRNKKRVGGTKTVHIDIIRELQPDLIIANKEENRKEQIEELAALYPIWTSNIQTIEDGLNMIRAVGEITGSAEKAASIADQISNEFARLYNTAPKRVAYFIWKNPWMCAGGDTFISDVMKMAGWENALSDLQRYPEIQLEYLINKNIDLVLLSSEPYPFKETHIAEIQTVLPGAKILLVDGEMFSWYGSRMKLAANYIAGLQATL